MQQVLKDLQDTVIVMSGLQARQASVLKDHSEWLETHERAIAEDRKRAREIDERIDRLVAEGRETDARIEELVSAIGERITAGARFRTARQTASSKR